MVCIQTPLHTPTKLKIRPPGADHGVGEALTLFQCLYQREGGISTTNRYSDTHPSALPLGTPFMILAQDSPISLYVHSVPSATPPTVLVRCMEWNP